MKMPSGTKIGFRWFSLSPCGFYSPPQLYGQYRPFLRPPETPQGDCAAEQYVLLWHSQLLSWPPRAPCEPVYRRYPVALFLKNGAHKPLYGAEFQSASHARV